MLTLSMFSGYLWLCPNDLFDLNTLTVDNEIQVFIISLYEICSLTSSHQYPCTLMMLSIYVTQLNYV